MMCRLGQRIISARFLPSAWRLVTYSLVAGSVRIRVVAIRRSALLAWRLPSPVEAMPNCLPG